ncbi:uncharacterized protein LOC135485535 [Lineus longissimus]|uniref:uncharacterized protein LOC135485535 n=1 Tax=Lineus longissimus TaxID=88925 RepID=UPI002B4DE564
MRRTKYFLGGVILLVPVLLIVRWYRVAFYLHQPAFMKNRPRAHLIAKQPVSIFHPEKPILLRDGVRKQISPTYASGLPPSSKSGQIEISRPAVISATNEEVKKERSQGDATHKQSEISFLSMDATSPETEHRSGTRQTVGNWTSADLLRWQHSFKTPKTTWTLFLTMAKRGMTTIKDKEIGLDLLRVFLKEADQIGINCFLYGGTLLGSWRHHGAIPWDDDIDIFCDFKKREELQKKLEKLKPDYIAAPAGPRIKFYSKQSWRKTQYGWRWPYLDVQFFAKNDKQLWDIASEFKYIKYQVSDVFPLHKRPFETFWINTPRNSLGFLKDAYTGGSLNDCETGWYNHKEERGAKQIHASCEKFKNLIPFVHRNIVDGKVEETLMIGDKVLQKVRVEKESIKSVTADPYDLKQRK